MGMVMRGGFKRGMKIKRLCRFVDGWYGYIYGYKALAFGIGYGVGGIVF